MPKRFLPFGRNNDSPRWALFGVFGRRLYTLSHSNLSTPKENPYAEVLFTMVAYILDLLLWDWSLPCRIYLRLKCAADFSVLWLSFIDGILVGVTTKYNIHSKSFLILDQWPCNCS